MKPPYHRFEILPYDLIDAGTNYSRHGGDKDFEAQNQLVSAMRASGRVVPLEVKPKGRRYELISGFRRFSAICELNRLAKQDGEPLPFGKIPCIVTDGTGTEIALLNITENIGRTDPSPMQFAYACETLQEKFGLSQADIARRLGVSPAKVAKALKIRHCLNEKIQNSALNGKEHLPVERLYQWACYERDGMPDHERQLLAYSHYQSRCNTLDIDGKKAEKRQLQGAASVNARKVRRLLERYQAEPKTPETQGAISALRRLLGA